MRGLEVEANSAENDLFFASVTMPVGLLRGDWVSVTPDDYGNPVHGAILAWTADEIVIRHEDPSVGKVNVHFPRVEL